MTTTSIWKGTAKRCTACLVFLCLWVMVPSAWAAYEVSNIITVNGPPINAVNRWTDDLTVQWTGPTMTGADALNGYVYKWNNSSSPLDDTVFNWTTGRDGTVGWDVIPPNVLKNKADLANLDSGDLLYLHIKTFYLDVTTTGNPAYSSDVVYGPFLIDNVAPTGTVRIVDASGINDVTSTSDTIVYLQLSAAKNPITMYLSETTSRPATGVAYNTAPVWNLIETTPGTKTIYAWFEDSVGNVSTAPATDSFTLLAPTNISPNSVTLDLATGATQVFRVEGTSATYTWTIINQVPVTQGATVAQFSGASSGTNSVTVQGLAKGTFQLQAVPTTGSGTLTSGTITVVQTTLSKDFSLITTATTSTNTIGFIFENTGITTAHELGTAVGSCTQVSKWNAATQSYLSHRMQFPTLNNFTLNVGEAYFVTVTDAHTFTLTGIPPASHTQTLITTATTSTNAIGVPNSKSSITLAHDLGLAVGNCSQVSKWNAATQSYLSHRMQFPTLNNFPVAWGEGYFITVTQQTNWPW
jgi:hypothetical protein